MKPSPGIIVKAAIMPGIDESLDFDGIWFRHYRTAVIKPGPGIIVKTAILP